MSKHHTCDHLRDQMFNYRRGELAELDAALFREGLDRCPSCGRYIGRMFEMMDEAARMDADAWLATPMTAARADDLFARIADEVGLDPTSEGDTHALDDLSPWRDLLDTSDDADDARHAHLLDALGLAADADADAWLPTPMTDARADDLFARIAATIEAEAQPAATSSQPGVYLEGAWASANDDDHDDVVIARSPLRVVFAAAAAALVAGLGLWFASQQSSAPLPTPEPIAHDTTPKTAPSPTHTPEVAPKPELVVPPTKEDTTRTFAALQRQDATPRSVRVFASSGARWKLTGKKHYTLKLDDGTVLVEFLPSSDERLEVITADRRVAVIGTVFYVTAPDASTPDKAEAKPGRVGVLTGKVKVRVNKDGQRRELELGAGQEVAAEQVKAIKPQTFEEATRHVDLERHELMLQRIREAHTTSPAPAMTASLQPRAKQPPPRRPAQPDTSALRADARQAMSDRDWRGAASTYEQLLAALPDQHPEQATLRLELARLYMRHLHDRSRAIGHLRAFIATYPGDVATPSARRQLCRLLGAESAAEPSCDSLRP